MNLQKTPACQTLEISHGNSFTVERVPTAKPLKTNGAQGRSRTTDTAIFSRMLYQLSYLGMPSVGGGAYRTRQPRCPDGPPSLFCGSSSPGTSSVSIR